MGTETDPSPAFSRATITDVARAAGVSVSTVSKVINERYGVAPETTKRVMAVVTELGYETSLVASSLRNRRTNVIGILVPEFESFSVELLKGVSDAAKGTGYELLAYTGLAVGASKGQPEADRLCGRARSNRRGGRQVG